MGVPVESWIFQRTAQSINWSGVTTMLKGIKCTNAAEDIKQICQRLQCSKALMRKLVQNSWHRSSWWDKGKCGWKISLLVCLLEVKSQTVQGSTLPLTNLHQLYMSCFVNVFSDVVIYQHLRIAELLQNWRTGLITSNSWSYHSALCNNRAPLE